MAAQDALQAPVKPQPAELRRLWQEHSTHQPGRFPSDIAAELGVTEAELIASRVGHGATRLDGRWNELLNSLGRLGRVKTVTRNAHAVIEKDGTYPDFQSFHVHSMFVSDDIDLRITLGHWGSAFAFETPGRSQGSISRSIQFHAQDGAAVHKLFLKPESSVEAYYDLVARFQAAEQSDLLDVVTAKRPSQAAREVNGEAFLKDWSELQDTHHFFGLIHKHRVSRLQAMQLAEGRFTRRVPEGSVRLLFESLSLAQIKVMVFLGNPGCLQIHKGLLKKIVEWKNWLNVMDPEVEIHLKEGAVAHAWVVEKPTSDGIVQSLELFDSAGSDIASIFGVRTEGKKQGPEWHAALAALPACEVAA